MGDDFRRNLRRRKAAPLGSAEVANPQVKGAQRKSPAFNGDVERYRHDREIMAGGLVNVGCPENTKIVNPNLPGLNLVLESQQLLPGLPLPACWWKHVRIGHAKQEADIAIGGLRKIRRASACAASTRLEARPGRLFTASAKKWAGI